jgi:hypothetical protein
MRVMSATSIDVSINGKPVYGWEGSEKEVAALLKEIPRRAGKFTPQNFAQSALVHMRDGAIPDNDWARAAVIWLVLTSADLDAHRATSFDVNFVVEGEITVGSAVQMQIQAIDR